MSAHDACEVCYPFWSLINESSRSSMEKFDHEWSSRHQAAETSRTPGQPLDDLTGLVTICAIVNIGQESDVKYTGIDLVISIALESDYRDEIPMLDDISGTYVVLRGPEREMEKMTPFSSKNTASEESWSKATNWIRQCISSHLACNVEENAGSWRPTRLLDLAYPTLTSDLFRIVVTSELDLDSDERYTTLSHCWGSAQFLQLKKSTYDELCKGVKLDKLPKTFQEAIQVTRRLGVRFLWIDSLCILQDRDDLSDWLVEAAQMHKVYSHSFCNISAAGAHDSSKGLFFDRDPRISHTADVRICIEGLGLPPGSGYMDCSILNLLFWSNNIGQSPLNTRGWVLQERLLSPRVLHFARDQLYWECREHTAAECYPESLPTPLRNGVHANFKKLDPFSRSPLLEASGDTLNDPMFYHSVWNSVAQEYSNTRLTKSSDKLIALSGVAKHFATRINDVYVVGMWRRYLASSLLWEVEKEAQSDGSPSMRPDTYRAPSFSWLSVDGAISTAQPTDTNLLIEVVDFHLDYVSVDRTGLVEGGYINLRGQVKPFEMAVKYILRLQQLFIMVDGIIVRDPKKQDWENGPLVHLDVGQASFDDENDKKTLYYMPAQKQKTPENHVSYLLLVALDTSRSTYRRIGVAVTAEAAEIEVLNRPTSNQDYHSGTESKANCDVRTIRII
ncbi:heterokaryon incompatibility protein [Colletotrichum graminicola M1.001]|uniref:Heterokaryon incompatibility protein n=1 Tax=Colletotrichum graminicola (strain M1.001 / M2 / FGSC 10212) TaxID=645133 RepID=E3QTB9_COLGM|nr:heterokaryon incompatibility protein [Colletotrichum graminicola M1.001]EFQ34107.1 heterokaryon incompatibility protein [Colletotrichum graminicola M1.001]